MSKTISLGEADENFVKLVDEVRRTHETVTVYKSGRPACVVMSYEEYESLMETVELLSDPENTPMLGDDLRPGRFLTH